MENPARVDLLLFFFSVSFILCFVKKFKQRDLVLNHSVLDLSLEFKLCGGTQAIILSGQGNNNDYCFPRMGVELAARNC